MKPAQLDQLCINTIRTLSIDAVQKTQSGHSGTPTAAAPTAYCLWQRFLYTIQMIRTGRTATASCAADANGIATRDSSVQALNTIAARMSWLLDGTTYLSLSTKIDRDIEKAITDNIRGSLEHTTF